MAWCNCLTDKGQTEGDLQRSLQPLPEERAAGKDVPDALYWAAYSNDVEGIHSLLAHGVDINGHAPDGVATPLSAGIL